MPSSTERDLIEKSKGGDHQAFRKLVETNQAFAYAVAFRFTGNRNDAEDITQEAFIKLWKNIRKYRPGTKLRTWLYKIIMNLAFDFLKSAQRKQQLKSVDVELHPFIIDDTSSEKQVDDLEMLGVIIALAKTLTPKQQTVFILRDLESLPVEEVCEIRKMKSNLYYARLKIREGLIRHYSETSKTIRS